MKDGVTNRSDFPGMCEKCGLANQTWSLLKMAIPSINSLKAFAQHVDRESATQADIQADIGNALEYPRKSSQAILNIMACAASIFPLIENHKGYKTTLCNTIVQNKKCSYGYTCKFSHSKPVSIALNIIHHEFYKTAVCNRPAVNGVCKYKKCCRFIHVGDLLCIEDPKSYIWDIEQGPMEQESFIPEQTDIAVGKPVWQIYPGGKFWLTHHQIHFRYFRNYFKQILNQKWGGHLQLPASIKGKGCCLQKKWPQAKNLTKETAQTCVIMRKPKPKAHFQGKKYRGPSKRAPYFRKKEQEYGVDSDLLYISLAPPNKSTEATAADTTQQMRQISVYSIRNNQTTYYNTAEKITAPLAKEAPLPPSKEVPQEPPHSSFVQASINCHGSQPAQRLSPASQPQPNPLPPSLPSVLRLSSENSSHESLLNLLPVITQNSDSSDSIWTLHKAHAIELLTSPEPSS